MKILLLIVLVLIILFFIRKILNKFKFPKITALGVFDGQVKVGKTGVSLACANALYRKVHFRWKIRKFFCKLFRRVEPEEPLFYSNIPLRRIYCKLTLDHILRKVRFNFGSVVYVDEASLLCDCYLSKDDPALNTKLLEFFKLFGHETHCGYCIFNSQSISDLHIALRKCVSQHFFIHETSSKFFPFVSYCRLREERYAEDGTCVNSYNEDLEDSLKTVIFKKKTFKMYDSCAFSSLTDDLPTLNIFNCVGKNESLKATEMVSFRIAFQKLFDNKKGGVDNEN